MVVAALASAAAGVAWMLHLGQSRPSSPLTKLQLLPPPQSAFGLIAVSSDGRRIAFTAIDAAGRSQLWVRPLDSDASQALSGTDGASHPFWSPDSRFIAFFAAGKLKKIEPSGGRRKRFASCRTSEAWTAAAFQIAPDGRQVAAQREDGLGGADVWLLDSARGTSSRLTSYPTYNFAPIWSPDGSRIRFASVRDERWQLFEKPSTGGDETPLLKTENDVVTSDWSPDGRSFLYTAITSKNQADLWALSEPGEGRARLVLFAATEADENIGRFSPDGNWVAYQSNESGRYEVYVRQFRADGTPGARKWLVSTNGGIEPRWPRHGKELFYIGPDNMLMAVEVKTSAGFETSTPHPLFKTRPNVVFRYDAAPDGQRFLVVVPTDEATSAPATVVLDWFEELRRRATGQ